MTEERVSPASDAALLTGVSSGPLAREPAACWPAPRPAPAENLPRGPTQPHFSPFSSPHPLVYLCQSRDRNQFKPIHTNRTGFTNRSNQKALTGARGLPHAGLKDSRDDIRAWPLVLSLHIFSPHILFVYFVFRQSFLYHGEVVTSRSRLNVRRARGRDSGGLFRSPVLFPTPAGCRKGADWRGGRAHTRVLGQGLIHMAWAPASRGRFCSQENRRTEPGRTELTACSLFHS